MSILDFFDFISNSVLMPIIALLTCIFVAFFIGMDQITDEVKVSSNFAGEKLYRLITKYLAPVCIFAILVSSILNSLKIIVI